MTKIRDFIYLDVERLYSLYSQVFEGVADRIIQSYIDSLQQTDSSKRVPFLQESDIKTKVVEVSRRTENKFLYDYMYNQLEERISGAIVEASSATRDNYYEQLVDAFAIKVVGTAEIEDFQRTKEITDQFNSLGAAMHYITTFNSEEARARERQIEELEHRIEMSKDKNARSRAEKALEIALQGLQQSQRDEALARGLGFNREYLQYLSSLVDTFYPERFDVTIVPSHSTGGIAFRGVLDKKWLRVHPNFLRSLYSGKALNWTMIGQITRFPNPMEKGDTVEESHETIEQSLRDAYLTMTRQVYEIEKTFTVSKISTELIVSPLAIYRESLLPALEAK